MATAKKSVSKPKSSKKATSKKKTASADVKPDIIRLELVDKSHKKFWEAEIKGTTLVTRWGRIGAAGQEKTTKLAAAWMVTSARTTQVEAKLKKGYRHAKTANDRELEKAPKVKAKSNAALEAAVLGDLDDVKAWLVYGDWLQGEGDPRGELVAVQCALEEKKSAKLSAREAEILATHGDVLLGSLRKYPETLDGKKLPTFTWKRGFIHSMRISYNSYAMSDVPVAITKIFTDALAHPSAALVQEIVLAEMNDGKWDKKRRSSQIYEPLVACIAKAKPKALRRLVIGEYEFPDDTEISWTYIGGLEKLWSACPRLEELVVQGGSIQPGRIVAPRLRRATFITGGLPRKAVQEIAKASWPELEHLAIWFGDSNYGAGATLADIRPILEGKGLPKLKHLGLVNCELADEIAEALSGAKILRQLETLDLSKGTMTDAGASALAAKAKAFKHLAVLDLSRNVITNTKPITALARKTIAKDQRDAGEGRYVSVGE